MLSKTKLCAYLFVVKYPSIVRRLFWLSASKCFQLICSNLVILD